MKHFDILIPGNYFCDIIFTGLPRFPELGTEIYADDLTVVPGGVLNTVVALQRLGVKVGWIGALGNDFFSQFVRERAAAEQLDTSLVEQLDSRLQRVTVALSFPQERSFVSYVDPAPEVVQMLTHVWNEVETRHLHFNGLLTNERLIPILQDCQERGITVSMDCQHRSETLDMPLVQSTLSLVNIFMPNVGEALRLTGTSDLDSAAKALSPYVSDLVVKDGASGVHSWENGMYLFSPALKGIQALDTTGAGDVFNAGFLAAQLTGYDRATCLRWGNICGGLSTLGYGGCSAAPTLAQLRAWLETLSK